MNVAARILRTNALLRKSWSERLGCDRDADQIPWPIVIWL
jgi:hypothetical protein